MIYHVIYGKEEGEILHVHSVYDGTTGTDVKLERDEVLSALSDFFSEPDKLDVLVLDIREPVEFNNVRVNPIEKRLEPISPSERE